MIKFFSTFQGSSSCSQQDGRAGHHKNTFRGSPRRSRGGRAGYRKERLTFRDSSMVEQVAVNDKVLGSSPSRGALPL